MSGPFLKTTKQTVSLFGGVTLLLVGLLLYRGLLDDLPTLVHEAGSRPENLVAVSRDQTIGQTFQAPTTNISAIDLLLQGPQGQHVSGPVTLRIRRSPADQTDLRSATIDAADVRGSAYTRFRFAALPTSPRDPLSLSIEYPTGTSEKPLLARIEQPRSDGQPLNDYPDGSGLIGSVPTVGDLAFRVLARSRLPFGVQVAAAAVIAGSALLLGLCFRRRSAAVSVFVFGVGVPVIFLLPMLKNLSYLGVGDWDMNTTRFTAENRALLAEQTFPGWNPYLCGGTPLAGFPESGVFSPLSGTVLLGGPVVGFKVNVVLHGIVGFLGMLVWLRHGWRTSWLAAFLGAAVVCFSSFIALHLYDGHTRKIAIAWIPWVFYFLHRASSGQAGSLRFTAPAGVSLALLPLDGSVYLSMYTVVAVGLVSALSTLQRRSWSPLNAGGWTLLIAGLLAGVHLIPSAVSQAAIHVSLGSNSTVLPLRSMVDVFLDPNQDAHAVKFGSQPLPWAEYGAYIGIAPLVFGLLGGVVRWRALWPWLAMGSFFLLGAFAPPVQRFIGFVPFFGDLRNQQRMVVMVTIVVGLAAALGLDRIRTWLSGPSPLQGTIPMGAPAAARGALGVLVALVIGHLIFVNTNTLADAFVVPPPQTFEQNFRQGWARRFTARTNDSFPLTMENTVQNRGSVNRCSVAGVAPSSALRLPSDGLPEDAAHEYRDAPYEGEAFFPDRQGMATVERQETSQVTVRYDARAHTLLALNQNLHPGWVVQRHAAGQKSPPASEPAMSAAGLTSTLVQAGTGRLTFTYVPPGLGVGLITSAVGLGLALWRWKKL